MSIIIVALPKMEDAKRIRKILMSHGFEHVVSCTTASAALIEANQHQRGLFICSCRLPDMHYTQLLECMPRYFEMLLIGSPNVVSAAGGGIIAVTMPVKVYDLVNTVQVSSDGPESPDRGSRLPVYPEMQYGQRDQYGGDGPDDPAADLR